MENTKTTTATDRTPVDYVTYPEFAQRISVSKRYVANLVADGFIPTVKLGRRCVRIPLQRALDKMEALEA